MIQRLFYTCFLLLMICLGGCHSESGEEGSSSAIAVNGSSNTLKYYYALDLKNDSALIEQYKDYHSPAKIWPEIPVGIRAAGVLDMEIYLIGNRMVLMVEIPDSLVLDTVWKTMGEQKLQTEWQDFTWKFQQALPMAKEGEKWILMEKIFDLDDH